MYKQYWEMRNRSFWWCSNKSIVSEMTVWKNWDVSLSSPGRKLPNNGINIRHFCTFSYKYSYLHYYYFDDIIDLVVKIVFLHYYFIKIIGIYLAESVIIYWYKLFNFFLFRFFLFEFFNSIQISEVVLIWYFSRYYEIVIIK